MINYLSPMNNENEAKALVTKVFSLKVCPGIIKLNFLMIFSYKSFHKGLKPRDKSLSKYINLHKVFSQTYLRDKKKVEMHDIE